MVASTNTYGLGCAGTANHVPAISATGLPQLGNSGFQLHVGNGLPFSIAVANVGPSPTQIQIGSCRILVSPPWTLMSPVLLDGLGAADTPLPVPATPTLAGATLHFQYLVLDPNGLFLNGLGSLSNALSIRIGQ
ncbi:MAG: hypothetical protein JNN13_02985 [Planctomycetes bacterium]|nr:hypothetical protein [Planctomycetota bacterium]